jgi:hypothetical protein
MATAHSPVLPPRRTLDTGFSSTATPTPLPLGPTRSAACRSSRASRRLPVILLFGDVEFTGLVLQFIRLPDISSIDAMKAIRSEFAEARVIVLTTSEGDVEIQRALEAGARSYMLKGTPLKGWSMRSARFTTTRSAFRRRSRPISLSTTATSPSRHAKSRSCSRSPVVIAIGILPRSSSFQKRQSRFTSSTLWRSSRPAIEPKRWRSPYVAELFNCEAQSCGKSGYLDSFKAKPNEIAGLYYIAVIIQE